MKISVYIFEDQTKNFEKLVLGVGIVICLD